MYDVEDENRFWSKILTGEIDECWECVGMRLGKDGRYGRFEVKRKIFLAHRVSFQLYHNRLIKKGMNICHKCDNTSCVNPHHLFEGTQQDNMTDMWIKGRGKVVGSKGEKNNLSKLKEFQVKEIRAKYAAGGTTYKKLAKEYNVRDKSTIGDIINHKTWKHVE
jgi:hypothetical protein